MNSKAADNTSVYKIGVVSRLTGIPAETLRVWERRYDTVIPARTEAGDRVYDADDIARLRLIKQLVDRGDSIGSVASLPVQTLQARINQIHAATAPTPRLLANASLRLLVIGEVLSVKLQKLAKTLEEVELAATYSDEHAFENEIGHMAADVMIIDQPTLQADTITRVVKWLTRSKIAHAVIVYRFSSDEILRQLPQSKCSTLRAPVEAETLLEHCQALIGRAASTLTDETPANIASTVPALPRRFNDEALAKIAAISTTVKCECPHHLAELITSLSAFEQYSFECESTSPRDAALHAYLHNTASHARHMIEDAMELVIEAEDLTI
ncbi:MAG: MerR family transcriptional regulator [Gammaproteobacteria bacterium]|nr:MerR family transcriptional regulator [Gammaproteobacteria bacterium]